MLMCFNTINSHLFKFSIRKRLFIIMILIAIVPMALIGCFSYVFTSTQAKNEFRTSSMIMLRQISQNIDQYLYQTELITKMALRDERVKDALKYDKSDTKMQRLRKNNEIEQFMSNMNMIVEGISGIYIFTDYKIFSKYYDYAAVDYNYINVFKNDSWYRETVDNGGAMVLFSTHTPFQRKNGEEKVISFARVIKEFNDDKPLGVLLIDLNLNKFREICKNVNFIEQPDNRNYIIIDDEGKVVYSSADFVLSEKLDIEDRFLKNILKYSSGDLIGNIRGEKSYMTYVSSPYTGWNVIMYTTYKELIKSSVIIAKFIIIIAIFVVVLVFITVANIAEKWSQPIIELSNAVECVEKGDFDFELKCKNYAYDDEIKKLILGFKNMVDGLQTLIKRTNQLKVKQKQAELEALQKQINPHFLYNTLQSIQMKAVIQGQEEISDMIGALGELFKLNTKKSGNIVLLGHEIKHVELYIEIQKMRYGEKFHYIEQIDPQTLDLYTIRFILQPIVENAISHGIEKKIEGGYVKLKVYLYNGYLFVLIEDNGVGIAQEMLDKINLALTKGDYDKDSGHMGVKNVNDRIKLYFGDDYGIKVESEKNVGTKVHIKLPIIKNKEDIKIESFLD